MRWLTAAEGGRRSGPPTAPVYAATCVFPLGGEEQVVPGWPGSADQLSILVEQFAGDAHERLARVDFLVPGLAEPHLRPGRQILILEGPRVVGHAIIRQVRASTAE
ncbi:hypothetical protein L3i22_047770 [Actinoplanes sp. L3-i22]|nr:hypothetical protein L3i22_047770 [Actinoplanes sp. L3-i22]